jgi:hypothetical protein
MYGLMKTGTSVMADMSIPGAIGPNRRMKATGIIPEAGIMAHADIVGEEEAGSRNTMREIVANIMANTAANTMREITANTMVNITADKIK